MRLPNQLIHMLVNSVSEVIGTRLAQSRIFQRFVARTESKLEDLTPPANDYERAMREQRKVEEKQYEEQQKFAPKNDDVDAVSNKLKTMFSVLRDEAKNEIKSYKPGKDWTKT